MIMTLRCQWIRFRLKQWSVRNKSLALDNASIWVLYECKEKCVISQFPVNCNRHLACVTGYPVYCKTQSLKTHINPHLWSSQTKYSFAIIYLRKGHHYNVSESEWHSVFWVSAVVRGWHMTWYLWAGISQSEARVDKLGTNQRPGKRVYYV